MEYCNWANLPRLVGQLTRMWGKLAHVYLPYKSRHIVKTISGNASPRRSDIFKQA